MVLTKEYRICMPMTVEEVKFKFFIMVITGYVYVDKLYIMIFINFTVSHWTVIYDSTA